MILAWHADKIWTPKLVGAELGRYLDKRFIDKFLRGGQ